MNTQELFEEAWPRVFAPAAFAMALAFALTLPAPARAGCGCTKPPPPPASLRPAVTWPGQTVTLFGAFQPGQTYAVLFHSGTQSAAAPAIAQAVLRRDLADGVERVQLNVALPSLPLGPTSVDVIGYEGQVLALGDEALTVAPMPVSVPKGLGDYRFENYRAAVSRDGTVYIALDFGAIQHARVFEAQGLGLPLRFVEEDLSFYNVQGFLMQELAKPIPGLSSVAAGSPSDSDLLRYSRHEFNTHFLQHDERQEHELDPSDPNWHLDGTPHIDHDLQVLEIGALLADGSLPEPGATIPFTFEVSTRTFFDQAAYGEAEVNVVDAHVGSYDSQSGAPGTAGDVRSNGLVSVGDQAVVDGDAIGFGVQVDPGGIVNGDVVVTSEVLEHLGVDVPAGLVDLGAVYVGPEGLVLEAGSYRLDMLFIDGGDLEVENASGPVTLYVEGDVAVMSGARVIPQDADPERFAVYVAGVHDVSFHDEGSFYGVVYAPESGVRMTSSGHLFGALLGDTVHISGGARLHYDERLSVDPCSAPIPRITSIWPTENLQPGDWVEITGTNLDPASNTMAVGGVTIPAVVTPQGIMVQVPPWLPNALEAAESLEISIKSADGCRSDRTMYLSMLEEVVPPGPTCGLVGLEILLVPAAASLRRRARGRKM